MLGLKRKILCISLPSFCIIFLMYSISLCQEQRKNITINISNNNFALVKEERELELNKGLNHIEIEDIPSSIDPTSILLESLTSPGQLKILEQIYKRNTSAQNPEEVAVVKNETTKEIEEAFLKSILVWDLMSKRAGKQRVEISYITSNIDWEADYIIGIGKDYKSIDLSGWVTLKNYSGTSYKDAQIKLNSLEGSLIEPAEPSYIESVKSIRSFISPEQPPKVYRESFVKYSYSLERKISLQDKQTKQIQFIKASNLPIKKSYVYDGAELKIPHIGRRYPMQIMLSYREDITFGKESRSEVFEYLEFENKTENGLGISLPKGEVKIYKKEQDGTQTWIAADSITHTSKDKEVNVRIGALDDVGGQRKQVDFKPIVPNHIYDESVEVTLTNNRDQDMKITIIERLYRWPDWKITESNYDFIKKDSQTIAFNVLVPKNGEQKINYTVRYKW